jgi:hypothetical protein
VACFRISLFHFELGKRMLARSVALNPSNQGVSSA